MSTFFSMGFCLCWLFLLATTTTTATVDVATPVENSNSPDDDFDYGIFDWINESNEGGYFNPKQEFRPDTKTGFLGVFAKANIQNGEILCKVPHDRKIVPNIDDDGTEDEDDDTSDCDTANQLAEYMRHPFLYPQYTPYALYTRNQRRDQLPSWWSVTGQRLLLQLLNGDDLLPTRVTTILDEWYDECRAYGSFIQDEWWKHAAMLVQQRADDDIMTPAYDMYNHRNGKQWLNTETDWDQDNVLLSPHTTIASKDIQAGDQIYNSYNMCVFCFGRKQGGYGTQDIFRDYGFVEQYPQRWIFTKKERRTKRMYLEFDLEEIEGTTDDNDTTLVVIWIHKPKKLTLPQLDWVTWFKLQLQRLEQFQVMNDTDTNTADAEKEAQMIPTSNELEMIEMFRQANIVAMTQALQSLAMMTPIEYEEEEDNDEEDDEDEDDDDHDDEDDLSEGEL